MGDRVGRLDVYRQDGQLLTGRGCVLPLPVCIRFGVSVPGIGPVGIGLGVGVITLVRTGMDGCEDDDEEDEDDDDVLCACTGNARMATIRAESLTRRVFNLISMGVK